MEHAASKFDPILNILLVGELLLYAVKAGSDGAKDYLVSTSSVFAVIQSA
jgi:hypothetical protein